MKPEVGAATKTTGMYDALRSPALQIIVAIPLFLWPAILNGQYFYFFDTPAYVSAAADGMSKVLAVENAWMPGGQVGAPAAGAGAGASASAGVDDDGFVAAGRSVYYGAMLYVGKLAGSLWLSAIAQAAVLVVALLLTLQALFGRGGRSAALVVLPVVALASSASFFASYLMPDIFAGLTVLAIANLFFLWDRMPRYAALFWIGLLAAALLFHTSHMALTLAMSICCALLAVVATGRLPARAAGAAFLALFVGFAGEFAFSKAVEAAYGQAPVRPPFLMARTIDDGPGYEHLRETCPESGFTVCRFVDILPLSADDFLWRVDPGKGVYAASNGETRRALSGEQMSFVLAVLRDRPVDQFVASLRGVFDQLTHFGLGEFQTNPGMARVLEKKLPVDEYIGYRNSLLFGGDLPVRTIGFIFMVVIVAASGYIFYYIWRVYKSDRGGSNFFAENRSMILFGAAIVGGVLLNAAITGALSATNDRYQARVIWLVPMLAAALYWSISRKPAATERERDLAPGTATN